MYGKTSILLLAAALGVGLYEAAPELFQFMPKHYSFVLVVKVLV